MAAGSYTISFVGTTTTDNTAFIDAVRVMQATPSLTQVPGGPFPAQGAPESALLLATYDPVGGVSEAVIMFPDQDVSVAVQQPGQQIYAGTGLERRRRAIRPQDIVERPVGIVSAILRGNPTRAYPPVRRIVLDTGGTMVAVSEADIRNVWTWVEEDEGISPCFAAAAAGRGHGEAAPPGRARPERDRARRT